MDDETRKKLDAILGEVGRRHREQELRLRQLSREQENFEHQFRTTVQTVLRPALEELREDFIREEYPAKLTEDEGGLYEVGQTGYLEERPMSIAISFNFPAFISPPAVFFYGHRKTQQVQIVLNVSSPGSGNSEHFRTCKVDGIVPRTATDAVVALLEKIKPYLPPPRI